MSVSGWRELADEPATLEFGARLARAMPEAAPLVLYLHGELGAGKTTLARGMLQQLGEQGAVRSPTYALLAEYEPPGMRVVHLDLYRLDAPDELPALGLPDLLAGSRLWLIEWPERARGEGLPPADAHLWLQPRHAAREARFEPATARGEEWLAGLGPEAG